MSTTLDTADPAIGADPVAGAIEHVAARGRESGATARCFQFDTLVLSLRNQSHHGMGGLLSMIGHRAIMDGAATAWLDIVEGPDSRLEALIPAGGSCADRLVWSTAALYCLWDPTFGGRLTVLDRTARRGFTWFRAGGALPSWDVARPLLHVFKALSPVTGLVPVHAAAVGRGDDGILIAGRGGAGKTSLALACLEAGWRYVGDDAILIGAAPLRAINLYCSARIRRDMFERFPRTMAALIRLSTDSGEIKGEIDVSQSSSAAIGNTRIKAIVVPQRGGASQVTIAPLRRSVALRQLATDTLVTLPGSAVSTYDDIAGLLQHTPCFTIDPGPRLAAVPAALAALAMAG